MRSIEVVLIILFSQIAYSQGSLMPPGPPGPTMKTLDQVEPRIDVARLDPSGDARHTIERPGSYYLSENIILTDPSERGIWITCPDVTLDLNGFSITSEAEALCAVLVDAPATNCTIRNGYISNVSTGISSADAQGTMVDNLRMSNVQIGFDSSVSSLVKNCTFENAKEIPDSIGIRTGDNSTVENCIVTGFSTFGIQVLKNCSVSGWTAYKNGTGIAFGGESEISDCKSMGNSGPGIFTEEGSGRVLNCIANENSSTGIFCSAVPLTENHIEIIGCRANGNLSGGILSSNFGTTTIRDCVANHNIGYAISASSSVIENCEASYNQFLSGVISSSGDSVINNCTLLNNESDSSGQSAAISAGDNCVVTSCSVTRTMNTYATPNPLIQGVGVSVGSQSVVKDCTISWNAGSGIRCLGDCTIQDNSVFGAYVQNPTNPGIYMDGGGNRVFDNMAAACGFGLLTKNGSSGNLIYSNTCRYNTTNYSIKSGNHVAPIVVVPTTTTDIAGDSAATSFGTTDPRANLSYY